MERTTSFHSQSEVIPQTQNTEQIDIFQRDVDWMR